MNKKNILENLELKLAKTKEENKEKFEKIEKDFKQNYSDFLENIFGEKNSGEKRIISVCFQLEKLDNPEKNNSEIFNNSLKKAVELLNLSSQKKEILFSKISLLEKNKDFFADKINKVSDISKDINFPIIENLIEKGILTNTDLIDISLRYKEKKDFLESISILSKEKTEIIKNNFFLLNNTKTQNRIDDFKNDFKSEIESSKNINIYPNIINFVGKNYFKLKLRNKVETKLERLKRIFKIAFLRLYRLKYSGIDINEILRKIESLDDLDSMISLLLKFFEELKENPVLQKDYVVSDEIEETENLLNEAEENKEKTLFTEENVIKASELLEEVENKLTNADLEKILSEDVDLVGENFIDRSVGKLKEAKEKIEEKSEEIDENDLLKIFEELKEKVFELEEQKRLMFLNGNYDEIDSLNIELIKVLKNLEKMKKLLGIGDSDELNEEEKVITF
ncbi:hypothetical protein D8B46_07460 [Candidatus Gracilibacteria bacterium]|nr:MAG: hypothetical protein D8B46_07460 [Candidatus Gracilibacteria bacterium]